MSSNLPVRRTTRTTRTTVVKDKENAVTRPTRAVTRAKPTSSTIAAPAADVKATGPTRVTASTAATRAKTAAVPSSRVDAAAQGKRKREALGEVARPAANVSKPAPTTTGGAGKGKEKEKVKDIKETKEKFDGVVLKKPIATATTTATTRQSSKIASAATSSTTVTTAHRRTRSVTAKVQQSRLKEEPITEDDAMAIDPPVLPAPRRFASTRAPTVAPVSPRHHTTRRAPVRKASTQEADEAEAARAFKKRRTSSDAPEEDVYAEEEVEKAVKIEDHVDEADPNGDEWTDLDAEDANDPLMVSEYVVEIFEYLLQVEKTTMPNPNYMDMQKDLAWKMRGILTDWLIQVHSRFRLLPETLFLCVNIIDRFLSQRVVSLAKLQLVGITCMFIAAKVEEIVAPSATNFLYCADSSYTEAEILQAERYVLKTLDWNLSYPNAMHFLRRISKADQYNVQVRTVAKYLLEIQCLEWRLIAAPPSLVAAAAIWFARLILGLYEWTPNLAHYSSYPESALIPTANLMLNYLLKPIRHQSFYKKYAAKKFLKVSHFVREWALERWFESTQVSLIDELPRLKALIQEARGGEEYVEYDEES